MENKYSKAYTEQNIEVSLDGGTIRIAIDGKPINNLCAVGITTEGDDLNYAYVTLKIRTRADLFKMHVKQREKPSFFNKFEK